MSDVRAWGRVPSESRLAPEHRIFVNRNLRLASVQAIGFDLDHTLAHYRGPAVEELAFRLARRYLVETFGYPEDLLEIPYDRSFVIRGLVIDKRRGNILKMDYHNYVARGCHGFRMLPAEERKSTYRTGRVRMGNRNYVTVDTLFHLPEVYLYVVLVDLLERRGKRRLRDYETVFDEVRRSVDSVHADGSLKREILGALDRYIRKDPRLAPTLRELARAGKKLFLLTNSEYFYTEPILRYLLENGGGQGLRDWRELFSLIVVDARKPGFFTSFDREPVPFHDAGAPGPIFLGGNARFLEGELGFSGDEILYFGDHTYGDILRSKKNLGWRTAMVVEELRDEMDVTRRIQPQLDELNHWKALRSVLESDLSALEVEHRKLERRLERMNGGGDADRIRRKLQNLGSQEERLAAELENVKRVTAEMGEAINESYNSRWGPLFREGQEMSRFAHQVKDFACLYMTRVSNLLFYDMNHYFRSAAERMPHEIG